MQNYILHIYSWLWSYLPSSSVIPKNLSQYFTQQNLCHKPTSQPTYHPVLHLRGNTSFLIEPINNKSIKKRKGLNIEMFTTSWFHETPWLWLCQQRSESKGHDLKEVNIDVISKCFIQVICTLNLVPNWSHSEVSLPYDIQPRKQRHNATGLTKCPPNPLLSNLRA